MIEIQGTRDKGGFRCCMEGFASLCSSFTSYFFPSRAYTIGYAMEIFGLEIGYTSRTLPFRLLTRPGNTSAD